jgi:hypothetical protein
MSSSRQASLVAREHSKAGRRLLALTAMALAVAFVVACVAVAPAFASAPWWHLTTVSSPAQLPPAGEGEITVMATNLGDGSLSGVGDPVRISDKLPPGLKETAMRAVWGANGRLGGVAECSSLTCEFEGTLTPYETLEVVITVKVEPGAHAGEVNEATVSGGGLPTDSDKRPIAVSASSATPVPFGVENYELSPENEGGSLDTRAGSHPFQLTTTLTLNQTASTINKGTGVPEQHVPALAKDLQFKLPAGLIGNPTPFPQCSNEQFTALSQTGFGENDCPPQTAVGVAVVTIYPASLHAFITVPVPVFNLTPNLGEPARFGFDVLDVPVYLDTSVRTGSDYGVTVSVENISESAVYFGSQVIFWGVPGDPSHNASRGTGCVDGEILGGSCESPSLDVSAPFLDLPTSCTGPLRTSVEADSWKQAGAFTQAVEPPFSTSLDGCNKLSFEPEVSVAPDVSSGSSSSGLMVKVHVPQEESLTPDGLAQSTVRSTTVTLPEGVALNASGANGLEACSEAQIGYESFDQASETELFTPGLPEPFCPNAAKIGTVHIKTPLLPNELTGAVYLATPAPSSEAGANPFNSLVAMYIVAEDPVSGVLVKLPGEVHLTGTGQIVTTFKNTPQLPFEDLKVEFFGGERAPLATPALCGAYTTTASIGPWSGNPPAEPSSTFDIASGPNGSPCASPLPFAPSLTAQTTSIQAGGYTPFTMTMGREDGNQNLNSIQLKMPPGLLGTLSSVKLCGEQQANAGTCGPESLIGHTVVSVGIGGDPYTVTGGEVFITGPYDGAPYGLSIVNPAKAGPFNLGKVVVRAKIEVDPTTAALTIATDQTGPYKIPTIIDGIPLEIKHVYVSIDRPSFTFNPTDCSPLEITGSLTSSEGSSDALSVPFQVTNCAVLAFKPKLQASASGKVSRLDGTSFSVKLSYPAGPYDANIARVKVELPKDLPSRLPTLQKACDASVFEANPAACPAASVIGHATATTPVLPVPLSGPAYFVSHGGEAFPSLIIVLQGYGTTVHLVGTTFISKAGVTSSTFKTVPDVPVGTFELNFPAGRYSALTGLGSLCKQKLAMPTEFVGQNGTSIDTKTSIAVTGCPKAKKSAHKQKAKQGERHGSARGAPRDRG